MDQTRTCSNTFKCVIIYYHRLTRVILKCLRSNYPLLTLCGDNSNYNNFKVIAVNSACLIDIGICVIWEIILLIPTVKQKQTKRKKAHCFSRVSEPTTEIIGGPELFIDQGSTINLTCLVQFAPEPPPTVGWTHEKQVSV